MAGLSFTERWCTVARPKLYKTAKQMQKAIDKYFQDCRGEPLLDGNGNVLMDKKGNPILTGARAPTITGLALALGFNSRQALLNYQARPEFNDTITRAKTRCEEYAESRLYDRDGARGAEFSLKYNFRWDDSRAAVPGADGEEDPLSKSLAELAKELDADAQ